VPSPQARPGVPAEAEEESGLRAGLASRVLSGPGLWLDWLEDLDRLIPYPIRHPADLVRLAC
jgi:hypothetical protein